MKPKYVICRRSTQQSVWAVYSWPSNDGNYVPWHTRQKPAT